MVYSPRFLIAPKAIVVPSKGGYEVVFFENSHKFTLIINPFSNSEEFVESDRVVVEDYYELIF